MKSFLGNLKESFNTVKEKINSSFQNKFKNISSTLKASILALGIGIGSTQGLASDIANKYQDSIGEQNNKSSKVLKSEKTTYNYSEILETKSIVNLLKIVSSQDDSLDSNLSSFENRKNIYTKVYNLENEYGKYKGNSEQNIKLMYLLKKDLVKNIQKTITSIKNLENIKPESNLESKETSSNFKKEKLEDIKQKINNQKEETKNSIENITNSNNTENIILENKNKISQDKKVELDEKEGYNNKDIIDKWEKSAGFKKYKSLLKDNKKDIAARFKKQNILKITENIYKDLSTSSIIKYLVKNNFIQKNITMEKQKQIDQIWSKSQESSEFEKLILENKIKEAKDLKVDTIKTITKEHLKNENVILSNIKSLEKDTDINTNSSGISISKKSDNYSSSLNLTRSENNINLKNNIEIEDNKLEAYLSEGMNDNDSRDFGAKFEKSDFFRATIDINTKIGEIKDTRLKGSLALLYAGANLGTYIEVEKGSEIERLALTQSIAIKNGKIQLSVGFLEKVMKVSFAEVGKEFSPTMKQKTYGIDFNKYFDKDSIINELKTSVVYYDIDNAKLGHIGNIIKDTPSEYEWSEVYGGIRGGSKLVTEAALVFNLHETFKLETGLIHEKTKYNEMYDTASKTESGFNYSLKGTWQPTNYDRVELSHRGSNTGDETSLKYTKNFRNNVDGYVELRHKEAHGGIEDDSQARLGLKYTFGDTKRSKLSPLYAERAEKTKLLLDDLSPNSKITTDNIQVYEQIVWKDRIVYIDKTTLRVGDSLDKNDDNTLKALLLDNGGFAINTITGLSDNSYSPFIKVVGGQLAIVDFKGLNQKLASDGLSTGQSKTLNVSVNDTSGVSIYAISVVKGSVEIKSNVKRVFNVPVSVAQAFVNGTLDPVIRTDLLSGTLSAGIVEKIIDGTITQIQVDQYKAGTLTAEQLASDINLDITPNAFDIPNLSNQARNTSVITQSITVTGINSATTVSTTVGTLVIDGVDTGLANTTVINGKTVAVKLTTSNNYLTPTNGTLTIGGVSDTFSVTTEASPEAPIPATPTGSLNLVDGYINSNNVTNVNPTITSSTGGEVYINGVSANKTLIAGETWSPDWDLSGLPEGAGSYSITIVKDGKTSEALVLNYNKDTVVPSGTLTWGNSAPNIAGTQFYSRELELIENGSGLKSSSISVTTLTGSNVNNISVSGNTITFDIFTSSDVGDQLTFTGEDNAGNPFELSTDIFMR